MYLEMKNFIGRTEPFKFCTNILELAFVKIFANKDVKMAQTNTETNNFCSLNVIK